MNQFEFITLLSGYIIIYFLQIIKEFVVSGEFDELRKLELSDSDWTALEIAFKILKVSDFSTTSIKILA